MDHETAAFWLDTIAAIGVAAWAIGAWFVQRTRATLREPLAKAVEVAASPAAILQRLASTIAAARPGSPLAGSVIDAVSATELRWHSKAGPHAHVGVVQVDGTNTSSSVTYGLIGQSRMLRGATWALAIGALAVPGIYLLLRTFALPSDDPNVRGQVIQMAQCVHALWPPFLLAGLARGLRRGVGNEIERTLRNLPFTNAARD